MCAGLFLSAPANAAPAAPPPLKAALALADWQLAHLEDVSHIREASEGTRLTRGWEQAVFWIGMTDLAASGAPARIRQAILDMGARNRWRPGDSTYFADDQAISQAYVWAASHGAGPAALAPTRATFGTVVTKPAITTLAFVIPPQGYGATECLKRWCWCDALFMAPPAFVALSDQTRDPRYRQFALKEFWATTDFLYDPAEHLYYRDSRFFDRRDSHGRKVFWSRGNGWVMGGMARIIPRLAKDSPDRRRMEALFREMAARVATLQRPDGYWPPSLLAPENAPPETSGTAFYTYALAWGIEAGVLSRSDYEPTVRKGWAALLRAIQPDGRLGWVQQVGDQPDSVSAQDTQFYGVGAFLLAATAVAKLDRPS
ncbi:glycoside hydrolase family 88 protein [Novosphingobium sp. 1949]|uniref:Glycoside hydrolase family 88 protein n=1 Tax=Novosphingobium organovorum TaxID=2930092 RepID=A0ABT0BD04_9SPHN|nr:glycoside hydrolase family 88 protein [Novosphingobium organovorum]MCJ2182873.1 glycoside hydrolase family 88 protein [Novosphingobium organovorum]